MCSRSGKCREPPFVNTRGNHALVFGNGTFNMVACGHRPSEALAHGLCEWSDDETSKYESFMKFFNSPKLFEDWLRSDELA